VINDQTGIFHVEDLHHIQIPVHEDKHCSIPDILVHRGSNNTAQRIKAFSHIYRQRIEKISKGVVKMEHTLIHQGYQGAQAGEIQVGFDPKGDTVGIGDFKLVVITYFLFLRWPGLRDLVKNRRRRFYYEWNKLFFTGLFSDSFLPIIECRWCNALIGTKTSYR